MQQVRLVKCTRPVEPQQPSPPSFATQYPLLEQAMRKVLNEIREARLIEDARQLANFRKL